MQNDNAVRETHRDESATDSFIRIDRGGQILEEGKHADEIFGAKDGRLVGRNVRDVFPHVVQEKLQQEITRVEEERCHAVLSSYDSRIGAWFEYQIFSTEHGIILLIKNVTAYLRTKSDLPFEVSSREQALEERVKEECEKKDRLKAAQDNLKMALAAARMVSVEYDLASGTVSFSEELREVLGVPPESAPRTPGDLRNWLLPEDYKAYMDQVDAAVNEGREYVSEFRIRNPETGEVRWVENRGRPVGDENGRPVRIHGVLQDITHRKRYQEDLERCVEERTAELRAANRVLKESRERISMALKNAPISMSTLDRNLRYTWLYHPFLSRPEKYIGKTADSFLSPDDAARLNSIRRQVLDYGTGSRQEMWLVIAGREVCYDMIMEPLMNDEGEIDGIISLALDITERKRSEEKLHALNTALEERAKQLRNFSIELTRTEEKERRRLASVLHDNLQQLLVGAKLYVQRSLKEPLDLSVQPFIEKLQEIIDEAITVSRSLTSELAPPAMYKEGLPGALRWLADWVKEKYGMEVTVKSDERTEEVHQELRVMIFQAVRELLFNVFKHAQVKQATVTLCYGGEDMIAVRVRDEGVGFNPDEQSRRATAGYGLMAIRERFAAIGGILEIVSSPGHGTTTTIKVPVDHPGLV